MSRVRVMASEWSINNNKIRRATSFRSLTGWLVPEQDSGSQLTRAEALRSLGQVVYALRTLDGLIKIGNTSNLQRRLDHLRYTSGKHDLLCFLAGDVADEMKLHQTFKAHLARGNEWYHPTLEIMAWVNDRRRDLGLESI